MTEVWKCSNCEADGAWKRWNGDRLEIHCTDCRVEGSEPLEPEWPEIIGEDVQELIKRASFGYAVSVGIFLGLLIILVMNAR